MTDNFIHQNLFSNFKFSKLFLISNKTVCIKHKDGHISKHPNITNPWRYIAKVKKEIDIENAWIEN